MSTESRVHPTVAGLDISTGHGMDSFFISNAPLDPWAPRCVATFIDTIINHSQVVYPLPSSTALQRLEEPLLPLVFVEGGRRNLIEAKKDISADQVQLSPEQLMKEYENFAEWARENAVELASWIRLHRETPRLKMSHDIHVPKHQVDEFWSTHRGEELARHIEISDPDLSYAFDVFVRSIQYHRILGEATPYFAHPVRGRAFGYLPVLARYQEQWSWGQYFVRLIQDEQEYRDVGWVLDRLSIVRTATQKYHATWYALNHQPKPSRIDLLSTIASESDLPARVKDKTQKAIKIVFGVGAAISSPIPIISIVLGLGVVAVELWEGNVPGKLGTISVFKGQLTWPGLLEK